MNHRSESVISYKRKGNKPEDDIVIILNTTPLVHHDWEVHVYGKNKWKEIFNSDNKEFWGTGDVFNPDIKAEKVNKDDKWYKLKIHLPALSAVVIR